MSSFALTLHENSGRTAAVTLECQPTGGTHPNRVRACRTLAAANGDFEQLPHEPMMCTLIWNPVTATATGHWRKRAVQFSHVYPNRCVAVAESARIFEF